MGLLLCLLQNNLLSVEMLFEVEKPRLLFRHRGGYSAATMTTSTLFLFYHCSKIELIVFLYRKTM